ncbi:MAG: hypothetical protein WB778_02960 [Thermoplasmata archaeon]
MAKTISLKLTAEQARLLEGAAKDAAFPSRSEFVGYAIARAPEEKLSIRAIQEAFVGRQHLRAGKAACLQKPKAEG